jgi:tetratricopeptide (TPR) repeat protein
MVLLEVPALSVALQADATNAGLLAFAAVHLAISLTATILGWWVLPAHLRVPKPQVAAFLFAMCFFVPVLGPGLLALMVAVTASFRGEKADEEIDRLGAHDRHNVTHKEKHISTVTGAMARLTTAGLSSKVRVDALLKLQIMESLGSNVAIRDALQDEAEEVRLTAFGILDIREKSLSRQIKAEHEQLKAATSVIRRIFHAKQLAWLYSELADQGLVEGEVLRHALGQIISYADQVIAENPNEAGMWLLKGRVLARTGKVEGAREALTMALELGLPESQGIPCLAELEFGRRRFADVRRLLLSAPSIKDLPEMEPVHRFWSGRSREAA